MANKNPKNVKTEDDAVNTPDETPVKDQRIKYSPGILAAYGINDTNIINQYFDYAGIRTYFRGDSEKCYTLRNNIIIDGKPITNLKELVEALGIKNK